MQGEDARAVVVDPVGEPVQVPEDLLERWTGADAVVVTSEEAARSVQEDGVLPGWESVVLRSSAR